MLTGAENGEHFEHFVERPECRRYSWRNNNLNYARDYPGTSVGDGITTKLGK